MTRIVGVDTARGVAVLGMFVAHLGLEQHVGMLTPTGWFFLADGRPSALFATLAGVGLAFMTRRAFDSGDPAQWRHQRIRILKRSGILYALGWILTFLLTPVAVILPSYAVMFVLALPFLRLRIPALIAVAGIVLAVAPFPVLAIQHAIGESSPLRAVPGIGELVTGYYPAVAWIAYLLLGIAVGRLDLRAAGVQLAMVVVGAAMALLGYSAGTLLTQMLDPAPDSLTEMLVSTQPHADSGVEMLGNVGVAIGVLGLLLLLTRPTPLRILLTPLSATGAMSLTVYSLHIVYIRILGDEAVWYPQSNWPLIWLIVGTFVFATLWQLTLGKGPFERAMGAMGARAEQPGRPGRPLAGYGNPPVPPYPQHQAHQYPQPPYPSAPRAPAASGQAPPLPPPS
ncbi:heparan-alpha-glucosaminide N-acetyltransferase domain-containing protein [Ruania halotolerans]|uniref:heparan-alpha-glucosaminide N-acetyltransferase domain-containing protein n=1 Tax=Ruania halotolerans TaxID=2897773 RepID=UPI001E3298BD|nr:heparan-alpha-glucosaminide N-acetyltransferase domain-containing protein [Ruania halotolerans]UFU07795.1 heparan-alpha-glucosaminide N-acetyltransferase domain-containing protein [Ruania halotolerans]